MTRVLLTGCGGPAAIGVARSLRKAERYYLVGTDCNPMTIPFAETDKKYLVPPAADPRYMTVLNRIIETERIDFVHAQPDPEVREISRRRAELRAATFLPASETVELCQDKFASYQRWSEAGIPVPQTLLLTSEADLHAAFATFAVPFWIRATTGAAGRGSFIVRNFGAAVAWIDSWGGWGSFAASELLPGRLLTWQSLWYEGELIAAQGRERLAWALGNRTPTGVTGVTGVARTISRADLAEIAERTILAIDPRPHGIFGVDLKEDRNGIPCPTEINIGRFFTTIQFFAELGLNFPDLYVRRGLGEPVQVRPTRDPLPQGVYWLRSMDAPPRVFREEDVAELVEVVAEGGVRFEVKADRTVTYV